MGHGDAMIVTFSSSIFRNNLSRDQQCQTFFPLLKYTDIKLFSFYVCIDLLNFSGLSPPI